MNPTYKFFLIRLAAIVFLSPFIGFLVLQIIENLKKASKISGIRKWIALSIVGFLVAILLGWLQ